MVIACWRSLYIFLFEHLITLHCLIAFWIRASNFKMIGLSCRKSDWIGFIWIYSILDYFLIDLRWIISQVRVLIDRDCYLELAKQLLFVLIDDSPSEMACYPWAIRVNSVAKLPNITARWRVWTKILFPPKYMS